MIENVLRDLGASCRLRSVCFRYFNAAGAHPDGSIGESHDPETHLIPSALEVILGRRDGFKVFGTDFATRDGTCLRDYVHVCDLATAHRKALDYLVAGGESGVWNLGTENGCTVLEVLQSIARVTGKEILWEAAPRRELDPARAARQGELEAPQHEDQQKPRLGLGLGLVRARVRARVRAGLWFGLGLEG